MEVSFIKVKSFTILVEISGEPGAQSAAGHLW